MEVVRGNTLSAKSCQCSHKCLQDTIFFARFQPINPFKDGREPRGSEEEKIKRLLDGMVDVPLIMNTMSDAIRQVALASTVNVHDAT